MIEHDISRGQDEGGEAHIAALHIKELLGGVRGGTFTGEVILDHFKGLGEPDIITYSAEPTGLAPRLHVVSSPALAKAVLVAPGETADKVGLPNNGRLGVGRALHSSGRAGFSFGPTNDEWGVVRQAAKSLVWGSPRAEEFRQQVRTNIGEVFQTAAEDPAPVEDMYRFIAEPILSALITGMYELGVSKERVAEFVADDRVLADEYIAILQRSGRGLLRAPVDVVEARSRAEELVAEVIQANQDSELVLSMKNAGIPEESQVDHVSEMTAGVLSVARTAALGLHELSTTDVLSHSSDAVSAEMLRMFPSVAISSRTIRQPMEVEGVGMRRHDVVFSSSLNMGRSSKVWGADATEFKPGRFEDDNVREKALLQRIAFGQGERKCIGIHVSKVILDEMNNTARHYDIVTDSEMVLAPSVTMRPEPGAAQISRKN